MGGGRLGEIPPDRGGKVTIIPKGRTLHFRRSEVRASSEHSMRIEMVIITWEMSWFIQCRVAQTAFLGPISLR